MFPAIIAALLGALSTAGAGAAGAAATGAGAAAAGEGIAAGAGSAGTGGISGLIGGAGVESATAEGVVRSGPLQLLSKNGIGDAATNDAMNAWIGSPERSGLVKQHGVPQVRSAEARIPSQYFKGARLKDIMQTIQTYIK